MEHFLCQIHLLSASIAGGSRPLFPYMQSGIRGYLIEMLSDLAEQSVAAEWEIGFQIVL
jgi:hypothetical protein